MTWSYTSRAQDATVGILGDGLALGTGAHPALTFDYQGLQDIMTGKQSLRVEENPDLFSPFGIVGAAIPPKILWPGIREYRGEAENVYTHLLGGFSRLYFNSPQYSWAYLVARKLGAKPERIFIAADEGAKVAQFTRQADRLLDALDGVLPQSIFVFFTSNDLCAHNMESVTSSESFGKSLFDGLIYLARNGKVPTQGSKVYVPHFMGLSQLLTKASILSHPLEAFGEKTTCRKLRQRHFQPQSLDPQAGPGMEVVYLSAFLPQGLATKCPTLFDQETLAQNRISFFSYFNAQKRQQELSARTADFVSDISTRIRSYREQTTQAVAKANEWLKKQMPGQNLTFHALVDTGAIGIEGEDLSQDCFHLNSSGQVKIARALLQGLGQK